MRKVFLHIIITLAVFTGMIGSEKARAQNCGPEVPVFQVDMTSDPNMTWLSPFVQRDGNCCNTVAPDQCVAFVINLHPSAEGIIFNVCDGALSPGAMFYQVNCGPPVAVGSSICLDGQGPHYLTFCKPGNNQNVYCITSVAEPGVSPDMTVGYSCNTNLNTWGFNPNTIQWNSISPGAIGQYNNYLSCTTCANPSIVNTVTQPISVTYQVCGMPLGGCDIIQACETVTVTLLPPLSGAVFPTQPIVCFGETTTTVNANGIGGIAPYTFNWSTGATGPQAEVPAGPAWVQITDPTGCGTYTVNFNVAQQTTGPQANAGADQIICDPSVPVLLNGSVTNATGGQWSGGQGTWLLSPSTLTNQYLPTALEALNGVTLTLTPTSNDNCPSASDQVTLTPGGMTGSFTSVITPAACFGSNTGAISVSGSSGNSSLSFSWSNGQSGSGLNTISSIPAGNYSVSIINTAGCDTTLSFVVSQPTPLQLTASSGAASCAGENQTLTATAAGGTGTYQYTWSAGLPAGNQQIVNPSVSTAYTVSVTDQNGCTAGPVSVTANVLDSTPPAVSAGADQVMCTAEAVNLNGSASTGSSVQWSGGNGNWGFVTSSANNVYTPTAFELQNGVTLTLTATSANGCATASDEITLAPGGLPQTVQSAITHVSCAGMNNGSIALTFTGANSNLTFDWNAPNAGNSSVLNNVPAGNYSVEITTPAGCDTSFAYTVLEPLPLQIAQLIQSDITCHNANDGSLFVQATGGTAPYTITLTNTTLAYSGTTIQNILPGAYLLTVSDAHGCSVSQNITFNQPDQLFVTVSNGGVICPGESITISVSAAGGTGMLSCTWNNGLPDAAQHIVTPQSSTIYTVQVNDSNGCTSAVFSIPVEVMILTQSGLNLNASSGVCSGEVAQVSAQFNGAYGPYSYEWSNGLGNQPGTFFTYPSEDTWYHFTVYDVCGNMLEDSVLVEVYEVPVLTLPGNLGQGCAPHTITPGDFIEDQTGWTWNWSFGDGFYSYSQNPSYTYQTAGTFNVQVMATTADGCVAYSTGNGTVNVFETPDADIIADPMITTLANPTITFVSGANSDDIINEWSFGNDVYTIGAMVQYTYQDTGTYYVTLNVVNEFGCAATTGVQIIVQPEYELIVPNVFTPNPDFAGDGSYDGGLSNDIFYPFTEYVEEFEMQIFNRWGELIFESNDIRYGWNGYYRGELCLQDVYAYKIKVTHTDGKVVTRLGDITLLR